MTRISSSLDSPSPKPFLPPPVIEPIAAAPLAPEALSQKGEAFSALVQGKPESRGTESLPSLSLTEFLKKYDHKTPGWFRTKNKPNGKIEEEDMDNIHPQLLEDFLRLTPADQKNLLRITDKTIALALKGTLQTKWIELVEREAPPAEILRLERALQSEPLRALDNETNGFTEAMARRNLLLSKQILADAESDTPLVLIPHVWLKGERCQSTTLAGDLETAMNALLAPKPPRTLHPARGEIDEELREEIKDKFDEESEKFEKGKERLSRTLAHVLREAEAAHRGKSNYQELRRRFPSARVEIVGTARDITVAYVGMSEMPAPIYDHYYYRVRIPRPDGSEEIQTFQDYFLGYSSKPRLLEYRGENLDADELFALGLNTAGQWEMSLAAGGITPKEVVEAQIAAGARAALENFWEEGDAELRHLAAQSGSGSVDDYFTRHFSVPDFYDHRLALHDGRQPVHQYLAQAYATQAQGAPNAPLAQQIALLEAAQEHLKVGQAQKDFLQKVLAEKEAGHTTDWDRRVPLRQIPAIYVDAVTGTKVEMPIFRGKTTEGKTFIVDLRDGGVYTGRSLKAAMEDFIENNEYGVGYLKYSLADGVIETRAAFDFVDKFWKVSEDIATYVGFSALATMMIPSPDPITKGYTMVAGLASMGFTAAASARRAINDWWHERDVDPIDVIKVASASLSIASITTGLLAKGAQTTTAAFRSVQLSLAYLALGTDLTQAGVGIYRLHSALDLDNPNLSPEERRSRYRILIAQAGVQAALVVFFNRKVIMQSVRYVGQMLVDDPTSSANVDVDGHSHATTLPPPPVSDPAPSEASADPSDPLVVREAKVQALIEKLRAEGRTEVLSYEALRARAEKMKVTVLGGYSGLGYEKPEAVKQILREIMQANGNDTLYVIGGTTDGIGQAYEWIPEIARDLQLDKIETAGIVSKNAAEWGVAPQDHLVLVDTAIDNWEVKENGASLMVSIAKDTGGNMVYFRGGEVSQAEIREAVERSVPVLVVNDPDIAPNAQKVAKKLAKNPAIVVDGTKEFVERTQEFPLLQIYPGNREGDWKRAVEMILRKFFRSRNYLLDPDGNGFGSDPPSPVSWNRLARPDRLYV